MKNVLFQTYRCNILDSTNSILEFGLRISEPQNKGLILDAVLISMYYGNGSLVTYGAEAYLSCEDFATKMNGTLTDIGNDAIDTMNSVDRIYLARQPHDISPFYLENIGQEMQGSLIDVILKMRLGAAVSALLGGIEIGIQLKYINPRV